MTTSAQPSKQFSVARPNFGFLIRGTELDPAFLSSVDSLAIALVVATSMCAEQHSPLVVIDDDDGTVVAAVGNEQGISKVIILNGPLSGDLHNVLERFE